MDKKPRQKMSRADRAKQFAPFDALKGLRTALILKEYEKNKIDRGEVQPETATKISQILFDLEKGDRLKATYYYDGYYREISGNAKLDIEKNILKINNVNIPIDDLFDLDKLTNNNPNS